MPSQANSVQLKRSLALPLILEYRLKWLGHGLRKIIHDILHDCEEPVQEYAVQLRRRPMSQWRDSVQGDHMQPKLSIAHAQMDGSSGEPTCGRYANGDKTTVTCDMHNDDNVIININTSLFKCPSCNL